MSAYAVSATHCGDLARVLSAIGRCNLDLSVDSRTTQTTEACSIMTWTDFGRRVVQGVDVKAGELIQVRDLAGRYDVLTEVLLAVEEAGATPLPSIAPARYLERLWTLAPLSHLSGWDRFRGDILASVDRIITLSGDRPDFANADRNSLEAWSASEDRLTMIEEQRELPALVALLPTHKRAYQLGATLEQLDAHLLPALNMSSELLSAEIDRALAVLRPATTFTLRTGQNCELIMRQGARPWHSDDGYISATDRSSGAILTNMPAGSLTTTVLESETSGRLFLPILNGVKDVTLEITAGRISRILVNNMADLAKLGSWLDGHSGDARRIGYLTIGLNPALTGAIGWSVVDQRVLGRVCVGIGDNSNYGGDNSASLAVTAVLASDAQLLADGHPVAAQATST